MVVEQSEFSDNATFGGAMDDKGPYLRLTLPASLKEYRAGAAMFRPGEQIASATFGNLIAHEHGHYFPRGQTIVVGEERIVDGMQEVIAIKSGSFWAETTASAVENGHRLWMGQPMRTWYADYPVPLQWCTLCTR
jgi:hypothetical protein